MAARILVIEDHPASLDLVRYLLETSGYIALTAVDGEIGLQTAVAELPDLVICDIQMPKMDGYQFLASLRQKVALRSIPVIAVTAFSMPGDQSKILAAGFEGYISKPIVPETFVAQVGAYLPPEKQASVTCPVL